MHDLDNISIISSTLLFKQLTRVNERVLHIEYIDFLLGINSK